MRRKLLGAIGAMALAGCSARYPLSCPPYDPAQYGPGPRDPYYVARGYVGPNCANPGTGPYYLAPPWRGIWDAPPCPPPLPPTATVPVVPVSVQVGNCPPPPPPFVTAR
jgi:hypothetical protein